METTKLSSKGQVIIPKAIRSSYRWHAGLELVVTETADGILLKPKNCFQTTELADVTGIFKTRVSPKSDAEIEALLTIKIREQWRGRD